MSLDDDFFELASKVYSFTLRPMYSLNVEGIQGWHVAIHDPGPPWMISGWAIGPTVSSAVRLAIDSPTMDRRPPEVIQPPMKATSSKPTKTTPPPPTKKTWSRK